MLPRAENLNQAHARGHLLQVLRGQPVAAEEVGGKRSCKGGHEWQNQYMKTPSECNDALRVFMR
jgi:hypothetical protein